MLSPELHLVLFRVLLESSLIGDHHDGMWVVIGHLVMNGCYQLVEGD